MWVHSPAVTRRLGIARRYSLAWRAAETRGLGATSPMSRRFVLYTIVIVSLLGAVTFPGAVASQAAAAPSTRRVASVRPLPTTTTTATPITTTTAPAAILAPVITRVQTGDPVVFLTIDDGAFRDPAELPLL